MMRVSAIEFPLRQPIDSYGPGFFRIGGEVFWGPVALLPSGGKSWTGKFDCSPAETELDQIDLVVVGTGAEFMPIPEVFLDGLRKIGIETEAMPTPAACRTYNMLLAEGRRVAIFLVPV